jgi:hypothetical protein
MPDVDLIATKNFSYSTRRLKAGDRFTVTAPMARVLVAIGKAQEPRKAGKVPPPPASVMERVGTATPTADEAFAGFLDRSIPLIAEDLPSVGDTMLKAYLEAEKKGKSRRGLIAAIDAEMERRAAAG